MSRFYNWCIVKNIKKDATHEEQIQFVGDYLNGGHPKFPDNKMKYIIWTLEKEENLHYHFYVEFTEKVSMKWIKEEFNDKTLHCDPRSGTQKQAIDYVKKIGEYADKFQTKFIADKPYFEMGEMKHQGNRSDLDSIVDAIEEGMTGKEILMLFRGNALRHINMIYRGLKSFHDCEDLDHLIRLNRAEKKNS